MEDDKGNITHDDSDNTVSPSKSEEEQPVTQETIDVMQSSIAAMQAQLIKMQSLLDGSDKDQASVVQPAVDKMKERLSEVIEKTSQTGAKIIEGVFDGEFMIGANGNKYNVPPNYASKSKLVEGDILKLTIGENGNFIYKQIMPIDRDRIVGVLSKDPETGEFFVEVDNDTYKVINASVTYFKGEPGDEAILLKPKNTKSKWAAIENIVKN